MAKTGLERKSLHFPIHAQEVRHASYPLPPSISCLLNSSAVCLVSGLLLHTAFAGPVPGDFDIERRAIARGAEEFSPGRTSPPVGNRFPREPSGVALGSGNSSDGGTSFPPGVFDYLSEPGRAPQVGLPAAVNIEPDSVGLAVSATTNITNDVPRDAETTITSIDMGGKTYVVTVFYKYTPNPKLHFRTTDGATVWSGTLALPTGYDQLSYDPYLAINPYSNGVMPKTIYLVGNAATQDSGGNRNVAVVGWRSLDGGRTWQGPVIIAKQSFF